jgi:transcriptional regulator with XRE-family HTH domain
MSTLAERVTQRMEIVSIKQADLARASNVRPASIAQWRNGRTKAITGETLLLAAQALQCSPKWLATGLGPVNDSPPPRHAAHEPMGWAMDDAERELLKIFGQLSDTGRQEALAVLRYVAAKETAPPLAVTPASPPPSRATSRNHKRSA